VLFFFATTAVTLGFTLAVVFQLAHCVEEASFPAARHLDTDWATHQVETTVDFASKNRWLTWYVGGLDHQIEHHLFPRMCHLHYPIIAPIVEATCREFDIPYRTNPSLLHALRSHFRWLARMGAA
jgi:linoleoyl-CoA desaturase